MTETKWRQVQSEGKDKTKRAEQWEDETKKEEHWEQKEDETRKAEQRESAERRAERIAEAQRRKVETRRKAVRHKAYIRQSSVRKKELLTASRNAGEKRSYIVSARACGARGECSHEHTRRDAHLAPLTPLTGVTHARSCVQRVRAQYRLRGNPQTRGACIAPRNEGAYNSLFSIGSSHTKLNLSMFRYKKVDEAISKSAASSAIYFKS